MNIRPYHLPGTLQAYLPDKLAPVDRWLQAANASNAQTTVAIIQDLVSGPIVAVLDPFAGAGSSAAAARIMSLPFLGIELDPVLVCACLAKTFSEERHAKWLAQCGPIESLDEVTGILPTIVQDSGPEDVLIVACLALIKLQRARTEKLVPLSAEEMISDLALAPRPRSGGRVIWGDSRDPASWTALRPPPGRVVIYTSPPFGSTSPRLARPAEIEMAAEKILVAGGVATTTSGPGKFPEYERSVAHMVRQARSVLESATLIIEHEPSDDGSDSRILVAERLESEFKNVKDIRILENKKFSERGPISFIVCEW